MKRTIKEVYDLIAEKRINAFNAMKDSAIEKNQNKFSSYQYEYFAYGDVLYLIESSHLLEEDKPIKGSGLEALEELRKLNKFAIEHKSIFVGEALYQIIEQELKEGVVNKKVLDIIKEKRVDVGYLLESINLEDYNEHILNNNSISIKLTQEEFELLRRYYYGINVRE